MTIAVDLFGQPAPRLVSQRQLPLPLAWEECRRPARDLVVGDGNRPAVEAIAAWHIWRQPLAVLYGPPRSGKSALAGWFRQFAPAATVIDPATAVTEEACFHACNRALAGEGPLLLTIAGDPGCWRPALADLATRVNAAQQLSLNPPGPEFVAALLQHRLADAGQPLSADAARFVAERSERSYVALDWWAEHLIGQARLSGQRLTLPVVRDLWAAVSSLGHASLDAGSATALQIDGA